MSQITIRTPATTANLGPGFDCLGLALDLWNETSFVPDRERIQVEVEGEGNDELPGDETNLIIQAMMRAFEHAGIKKPQKLQIRCINRIPLRSGLGSSAAAVVTGLMGANALMGEELSHKEIMKLASEMEGHPDNVAAAIYGGLTISAMNNEEIIVQKVATHDWDVAVILPDAALKTEEARAALPKSVNLQDAVFNIGRTALVVEALGKGNMDLLRAAMEDKLHQPYRLPLIPGAGEAIRAARAAGAAAALSGAGPSVIAFAQGSAEKAAEAMEEAFREAGARTRRFMLRTAKDGAEVEVN